MPFRGFVGELENALDENEVDRLVVDLRQNGGGASRMILPLVELIESRPGLNREGHLFVLVSNNTFSAAVINVNDFRQRTDATFIGLPTGGQPQSPGEVRPPYLTLPNSGIEIQIATRMITRLPDLVGETNAFYPPIQLESTFAEYLRGEDAALQYALSAE